MSIKAWFSRLTLRRCSCGLIHINVPEGSKTGETGDYWQCICESTLFRPNSEIKRLLVTRQKQARKAA